MLTRLFAVIVIAAAATSCSGPTDPSKNKTETFSGTVQPQQTGTIHTFDVPNNGEFNVNFTAFAPGNVFIGVAWGQVAAGNCNLLQNNPTVSNTNVGRTVISGSVITKGEYCVFAFDPSGSLGIPAWTVAQNYTLTVSHP
jgi:hypothetical protein